MNFEQLMNAITEIAQAERVTKARLSELSRELLTYMLETEDVRPINALLGTDDNNRFVLTPMNWRIAVQYFAYFLPFTSNYEEVKKFAIKGEGNRQALVFNKKAKKRWDKCVDLIKSWLDDDANDIWLWSNNATVEAKPVDYAKQVTQVITKAMDEDKGNLSLSEVMAAVLDADVSIDDMMGAIGDLEQMELDKSNEFAAEVAEQAA